MTIHPSSKRSLNVELSIRIAIILPDAGIARRERRRWVARYIRRWHTSCTNR